MCKPDQNQAVRALIVDGHALMYRAFFGVPERTTPEGAPSNAIFGFIRSLQRVIDLSHPTHGIVSWDDGLDPGRLALLPGYKANRPVMPDRLRTQFDPILEWLSLTGWRSISRKDAESDDIIGTLAGEFERAGIETLIMTPDKDFMQLVSPLVSLWRVVKDKEDWFTAEDVVEKTGVRPDQVVDWLSLIGDACDNIAGVPKVGPKTAAKLLNEFGSVPALYERIEEVQPERVRKLLVENRALVERNRSLVRLKTVPECVMAPEEMRIGAPDADKIVKFLGDWGLRSLVHRWQKPPQMQQAELF